MIFSKIIGSIVIASKNGVQYQYEAWLRNEEVFCKIGSGYVGLRRNGTSVDNLNIRDYDLGSEHSYAYTATGQMVTNKHPQAHYIGFQNSISERKQPDLIAIKPVKKITVQQKMKTTKKK